MTSTPIKGNDYRSKVGLWKWCPVWKCWQFKNYTYKIFEIEGLFSCSSHGTWHSGTFGTFELAEKEMLEVG